MMKWGKVFKGLLNVERRAAAIAALTGLQVKGIPVSEIQSAGETIGSEITTTVKQFKAKAKPKPPPSSPVD